MDKPYIAISNEIYIFLRHQELKNCKHIGYDNCCEEFFAAKHRLRYNNYETAIFFDLSSDILRIIVNLDISLTILSLSLQYLMVEMRLS